MANKNLVRMFKVLEAIWREDVNNTQYSVTTTGRSYYLFTDTYLGTQERFLLHSSCKFIFIWVSEYDTFDEEDFPEPDFKLTTKKDEFGSSTILCYEFPYKEEEDEL